MKPINFLLLLFTAFGVLSCNSDDNAATTANASFTAQINNNLYTAVNAVARLSGGHLTIVGEGSNGEMVRIECRPAEGMIQQDEIFMAYVNAGGQGYYNINPSVTNMGGTVTITSIDEINNTVSGTYSFDGTNFSHGLAPIAGITGSFKNVPLVDNVPGLGWPSNTVGGMYAAVNGNPFDLDFMEAETINGVLSITATSYPTMRYITVNVPEDIVPGSYTLSESNSDIVIKFGYYGVEATATTGTFEVLENTGGNISARFSATATDDAGNIYEITSGELDKF